MKNIKGVLIDTINHKIDEHVLSYNNYKDIVRLLKCEYITCVSRNINGVVVDIYCDDEALIRNIKRTVAVVTTFDGINLAEIIYNNCFICSHNKKGEIKSLPSKDIKKVLEAKIIGSGFCWINATF